MPKFRFALRAAVALIVGAAVSAAILAVVMPFGVTDWSLRAAGFSFALYFPFALAAAIVIALPLILLLVGFRNLSWRAAAAIGFVAGEIAALLLCLVLNFKFGWFALTGLSGVLSGLAGFAVMRKGAVSKPETSRIPSGG